jgi:hypothetical protein
MDSVIFKNLLNSDEIESLINEYNAFEKIGTGYFGLENVLNLPSTKKYHIKFKKMIEDILGEDLDLVRTFTRKYNKGDVLEKHIDKKELHHTLSIQLRKSDNIPNPLIMHYKDNDVEIHLENGDGGLIYEGNKIPHSRPPLESEYMYNLFLHYAPKSIKQII